MAIRTRLDPVVKLRERDEDLAQEKLSKANEQMRQAEDRLVEAKANAAKDHRETASASHWDLLEVAQTRALATVKIAEKRLEHATLEVRKARDVQAHAFRRAEGVRRVAEVKRQELRDEMASKEARELDEIASLLFWRRAG